MDSKEKIEFCRTKMQELVSILFLIIMPLILALKLFPSFSLWWGFGGKEFRTGLNPGYTVTLWMNVSLLRN